jgi:hypothetical protein
MGFQYCNAYSHLSVCHHSVYSQYRRAADLFRDILFNLVTNNVRQLDATR